MIDKKPSIVELTNIKKDYSIGDTQIEVLRGIDLRISAGEFVAIVGPSGNGKSTLLNIITGIDRPSEGEVWINETALHTMSEDALSVWRGKNIGIVFQFFQLLPSLSLLQNVILPMDFAKLVPRKERKERAMHLLSLVGLVDQAQKLPSQVSGGQQQRGAIARSLANDPPIIVADEPTGNLDSQTSADVFELFSHLALNGKTLIMVTHNQELACQVPRSIEIRNGQIVRDGGCGEKSDTQNGKDATVSKLVVGQSSANITY